MKHLATIPRSIFRTLFRREYREGRSGRVAMTLLVRNEADVVRQWLDFHLANGVDVILATDHRSTDGTGDILRRYEREGTLTYTYEGSPEYDQARWVTGMARRAFLEHDADWVINADADEFYVPKQGTLKSVLNSLPRNTDVVTIHRNDFPPLAESSGADPLMEMIYRKRVSCELVSSHLIIDKVIHRGFPDVRVSKGAHAARSGYFRMQRACEEIETLHFPIRSWRQFEEKISTTGPGHMKQIGKKSRYHRWWSAFQRGQLAESFQQISLRHEQLRALLSSGEIVEDRRIRDFLTRHDAARPPLGRDEVRQVDTP